MPLIITMVILYNEIQLMSTGIYEISLFLFFTQNNFGGIMYTAQITKKRIMELCGKGNAEKMLKDCSLGVNALRQMTDKNGISSFSLAKIADYLNCSVDYLLGRTDNPNSHKEKAANSVNGNYNAVDNSSVTVNTPVLDEHQKLLIELYNKLSPIEQVELISKLNKAKK